MVPPCKRTRMPASHAPHGSRQALIIHTEPACRTLAGQHDIDAFLYDCFDVGTPFSGRYRPVQPRPLLDGLRSWVRSGSGPGTRPPRSGPRDHPPVPQGPGTDRDPE